MLLLKTHKTMNCQFDKIVSKRIMYHAILYALTVNLTKWKREMVHTRNTVCYKTVKTRVYSEKDELGNVIAVKIEIETMSAENASTIAQ